MDAARPEGALMPHELASTPQEVDAIEFLQLCAFEAGEERWWLLTRDDGEGEVAGPAPDPCEAAQNIDSVGRQ